MKWTANFAQGFETAGRDARFVSRVSNCKQACVSLGSPSRALRRFLFWVGSVGPSLDCQLLHCRIKVERTRRLLHSSKRNRKIELFVGLHMCDIPPTRRSEVQVRAFDQCSIQTVMMKKDEIEKRKINFVLDLMLSKNHGRCK
jgi:hypothetical protein